MIISGTILVWKKVLGTDTNLTGGRDTSIIVAFNVM